MSGKGSKRRPAAVPRATVDANYERTFPRPVSRTEMHWPGLRRLMQDALAQDLACAPNQQRPASPDRTDAQR